MDHQLHVPPTPGRETYLQAAKKVATFLREDQLPSGNIYDRQEASASRDDHYGHSHFALLCALLFKATEDDSWLEPMRRAMLYCVELWEQHPERGGHRDFNDIAVAEAYGLVSEVLPEDERAKWRSYLEACQRPERLGRGNHFTIIYHTFYRLGQLFGRDDDCRWATQCMRERVLPAFAPDGFWCDHVGPDRLFDGAYWPMAYHPFNLAYLHRYFLASGDEDALEVFLRALDASVGLVAPDGDFNVLGRDQESNFSYTSLVYAYEAGAAQVADREPDRAALYREVARRAWGWLQNYLRDDGYFRIKPNDLEHLRGGYDFYENNVVYAALSAIHLMWAAELCPEGNGPAGSLPTDSEVFTWLPDSGILSARAGSLMTLAARGSAMDPWIAHRAAGMVPGLLKFVDRDAVVDLIPTPGGGTSEVHGNPRGHPRTGLLPYFTDSVGRISFLWEAGRACEAEETAEGMKLFGEGEVRWACDRDLTPGFHDAGIRQRRMLVLHRDAGLLIFDEFLGRGRGSDIRWVPYNVHFLGEPWRNDAQCDHVASVRDGLRAVYAVPGQEVPLARTNCSPYLSSKGPAYYFEARPRKYLPTMLASRLTVQDESSPAHASISVVQVTQDHAMAAYLADLELTVAVNFAEREQQIRAADGSWEVDIEPRSLRLLDEAGSGR